MYRRTLLYKKSGREKHEIESPSSVRLTRAKLNVACKLSHWYGKMNNDAQATLPANKHYEAANLIPFSVLESVWTSIGRILLSSTVWKKKLAGILGRCCFYVLYNSPRESIDIAMNQVSHTASTCRSHRHAALRFPCW